MTLPTSRLLITCALLALLNACGTTAPGPDDGLSAEQRGERAYTEGDYTQAAEYWQMAVRTASTNDANTLRVKTADAWLRSGRLKLAAELLSQVNHDALDSENLNLYYLAQADLAVQQSDPETAGFYLQAVDQHLPARQESRHKELLIRLRKMQRDPADRSLQEIAELSAGMTVYQPETALEILQSLESIPSGRLRTIITGQQYDPEFTEWLELALQVRTTMIMGDSTGIAAREWVKYHYGHPIGQRHFSELVSSYRSLYPTPSTVAVLLPDTGGLSAPARAIRDGVLSAYLERPDDALIRFYSSGENSEAAFAAYQQAWRDGATQIIGPLRIDSTRMLSGLKNNSVPILMLNDLIEDPQDEPSQESRVNSLSLSQTDEARAIAERILAADYRQAMIMVPDTDWGTRIATEFISVFEAGDGRITVSARFNPAESDHSALLTRVLKIDESLQRRMDLQARLGMPLIFEPKRRDDFDFIFIAANPAQGRALKPLLRFHDAGDIPVYAMGRVFSGRSEHASDQDLDGVIFPITRWQLMDADDTALTPASLRGGTFGNLYALGRDAWQLLPWLPLMKKDPDLRFRGDTGSLRMQYNGQLYREPVWAQFSAGTPVPYQWPDPH